MRCEPADTLIRKFGGLSEVARIVDATPHAVLRWRLPREKGGTGGVIPHWHVPKLLLVAQERDLDVEHKDFLQVVDVAAVESVEPATSCLGNSAIDVSHAARRGAA